MIFPEELKFRFKNFISERSGLYFQDHDLKGLEDTLIRYNRFVTKEFEYFIKNILKKIGIRRIKKKNLKVKVYQP